MTTKKVHKTTAEDLINYHRKRVKDAISSGDEIAISTSSKAQWHGLFAFLVGPGYDLARAAGIDTRTIAGEIDRINAKQCADLLRKPVDTD